ncbi:MAG: hypothetical protein KA124_11395 [Luteimonas sp.]|nr:hypothetical protein [Luteimonas sp.]
MAKLLLNLRHVPEDEADDVRGFLDRHRIAHYDTPPGPFGITAGGIWLREDDDLPQARRLMADYQRERQARVRAEHAKAREDGSAETFADLARAQPLQVAVRIVAIVLLLALLALPYFLLRA